MKLSDSHKFVQSGCTCGPRLNGPVASPSSMKAGTMKSKLSYDLSLLKWVASVVIVSSVLILVVVKRPSHVSSSIALPAFSQSTSLAIFPADRKQVAAWGTVITPFPKSFWYVKNFKVGGSTMAGIFRQICAHYGVACLVPQTASTHFSSPLEIRDAAHLAKSVGYEHAALVNHQEYVPQAACHLGEDIFLFTTIRHPVSRVLSRYFYRLIGDEVVNRPYTYDDGIRCIAQLTSNKTCALLQGFERHVVVRDGNTVYNYIKGDKKTPKEAFDQYDFVFVTERFDESLIAFMLQYGLRFEDMAYLKSKDRSAVYPHASILPKHIIEFLVKNNPKDIELFDLANESLNQRIQNLKESGYPFDDILRQFKEVNALVEAKCSNYKQWYSDHNFNTVYSYYNDNAIGTRCIRAVTRGAV